MTARGRAAPDTVLRHGARLSSDQGTDLVETVTRAALWLYATGTLLLPLVILAINAGASPWAVCSPDTLTRLRPAVSGVWRPAATTPRVLVAAVAVVPAWVLEAVGVMPAAVSDAFARVRVWLWFMGMVVGTWLMGLVLLLDADTGPGQDTSAWDCPEAWFAVPTALFSEDFMWESTSLRGGLGGLFHVLGHAALAFEGAWRVGVAVATVVAAASTNQNLLWCSPDTLVTLGMGMLALPEVVARVVWLPGCFAWMGPEHTGVVCALMCATVVAGGVHFEDGVL